MAVGHASDRNYLKPLDSGFAGLQAGVHDNFPGLSVDYESFDDDWHRAIIRVHGDRYPGGYYVLDLDKGVLDGFRQVMPWIKTNQMAEMRPIEFKARDGLAITVPVAARGREPRNLR
jgi:hypothetical protein